MSLGRVRQLARLAAGYRSFLRHPVGHAQARRALEERHARREERFLAVARRLVYEVVGSPYRRLLAWAGCEYADLEAGVRRQGIEATLERLRVAGVYLTLEEFKSRTPVRRRGLEFETAERDFDNPWLSGLPMQGRTSGSRAPSTRVGYDWAFIAEEAENERLLYEAHGVAQAPTALWFPAAPGIAGIHNLLMNLRWGHAPERWFSQAGLRGASLEARLALEFLCWGGRAMGIDVPRPKLAELSRPEPVVAWIAQTLRRGQPCVVRTFASSAVRLASAALERGTDLSGATFFAGGEPLTEPRRRFIESAGAAVFARYVSTETGLIGAACPERSSADDMHLYTDRVAVVPGPIHGLLFTTLTPHAGKVTFNTELGDRGRTASRPCPCVFGQLGLGTRLTEVRSDDKLTVEGMSVLAAELEQIIAAAIGAAGGPPDSYQFWEAPSPSGLSRLVVAVSPELTCLDERQLTEAILDGLSRSGPRTALASELWRQGGSVQVVRQQPIPGRGHKLPSARPQDGA